VQPEHLGEVRAGADDRADDGDAVEYGLEDRQLDVVVGGQGDEDKRAATAQRAVRLLERFGATATEIAACAPPRALMAATGSSVRALTV
jgi:hypothetical protein